MMAGILVGQESEHRCLMNYIIKKYNFLGIKREQ